jgi:hypothetical protein
VAGLGWDGLIVVQGEVVQGSGWVVESLEGRVGKRICGEVR